MISDKNFCLDSNHQLKKNHPYYTQIQVQMFVYDVEACQFIVWTPSCTIICCIERDHLFLSQAWPTLVAFYKAHVAPEILTRRLERGDVPPSLSVSPQLFCICQKPYDADRLMIGCDNPGCQYEWFHLPCLKMKRVPQGDWICKFCKKMNKKK
jgi:hypothetical protein